MMWVTAIASFMPVLVSLSPVLAGGGGQEIWWNISWIDNANPDGLHPRRVIGVNGMWPYVFISFGIVITFCRYEAPV
jgi:iron transport multicopper oxidase